jgi:hypothetical protein
MSFEGIIILQYPNTKEIVMADILTQEEIDGLFDVIEDVDDFINIDNLDDYLMNRSKDIDEKKYGIFEKNVAVSRFSTTENSENILDEIYEKNKSNKMGNKKIPNTNIELVNFSQCPFCKRVWSMKGLSEYYKKPYIEKGISAKVIAREDTTIYCSCNNRFNPSLLVMDGTPKNELQFLCRMQTVDAIEKFYIDSFNKKVLTKTENIKRKNGVVAIPSNILIEELYQRPALIINYIQYSSAELILDFIESQNMNQLLYGQKFVAKSL